MRRFRFHVLGIQHTATSHEHVACAYTQKIYKLCKMLIDEGHEVIHYGNELSDVVCSQHITVATEADLIAAYGDRKWMTETYKHAPNDSCYQTFDQNATRHLRQRVQPGDFLLCMWGHGHRRIADSVRDLKPIIVEPGIGYAGGHFAKYKVFESYAMLHCYYGTGPVSRSHQTSWHDVVIPNYFDPADFRYEPNKSDYMLFLGRLTIAKGTNIACEIARDTGRRLIVAGQNNGYEPLKLPNVEYVGFADVAKRRELLAGAYCVLTPSMFIEPFCGVHIEAMFSGTPVISTDWGVFTETNIHGVTGWRCRTYKQFLWAVEHAKDIKPEVVRAYAMANFSMDRIVPMYETFWRMCWDDAHGKGWQSPDETPVTELDWMRRSYPS